MTTITRIAIVAIAAAITAAASPPPPVIFRQIIDLVSPAAGCTLTKVAQTDHTVTIEWRCVPRQSTAFLGTHLTTGDGRTIAIDTNGHYCRGACE